MIPNNKITIDPTDWEKNIAFVRNRDGKKFMVTEVHHEEEKFSAISLVDDEETCEHISAFGYITLTSDIMDAAKSQRI